MDRALNFCELQVVVVVVVDIKAEIVVDGVGEVEADAAAEVEAAETEIGAALIQGLRLFSLVCFTIVTFSIESSVLELF